MKLEQRAAALLELVETQRKRRCAELLGPAQAQARDILRAARTEARRRVHATIVEQRQRMAAEIGAAQARLATERRLVAQGRATRMLALAWAEVSRELQARWQTKDGRRRWVESHLTRALSLPREVWEIRHPRDWPEAERDAAAAWLTGQGISAVRFAADESIAAGLRMTAGHNSIDATLAGLLAERAAIEGRLLDLLGAVA